MLFLLKGTFCVFCIAAVTEITHLGSRLKASKQQNWMTHVFDVIAFPDCHTHTKKAGG